MATQYDRVCEAETNVIAANQQEVAKDTKSDSPSVSMTGINRKRGWSADVFQYGSTNQNDVWNNRNLARRSDRTRTLDMSAPAMLGGLHRTSSSGDQAIVQHANVPSESDTDSSSTVSVSPKMTSYDSMFTEQEKSVITEFSTSGFSPSDNILSAGKFGKIYAFGSCHVVKSVRYWENDPTFTMREVNILYALRGCKGVIRMLAYKHHHPKGVTLLLERYQTTLFGVINQCTYLQALGYAEQLCRAVDEIHRMGVMHRDLHAGNILVRDGVLCLTDFGNSKFVRGYRHSAIVTSLPNIAPEQITCSITGKYEDRISVYDHRCDLWALGCVLHELYAAEHKFAYKLDDFLGFHKTLRDFQDFHIDPSTQPALLYATSLLIRKVPRQRIPAKRVSYILKEAYTIEQKKHEDLSKRFRCCDD